MKIQVGQLNEQQELANALFIGCFPTGLSYADKRREVGGDWLRVAFLPFNTLALEVFDEGSDLLPAIQADAAIMAAMKGKEYQVSTSGQTVLLGGRA